MAVILKYIEYILGTLLRRRRGYDAKLFTKTAAFIKHPTPTIEITSPDCGPSNSKLSRDYSMFGKGLFPTLEWPKASENIKEYLLISEDVDAPFGGKPNVHGIYCRIPAQVTSIGPSDLESSGDGTLQIKSGWKVGKNRRGIVYIPCRPPLGHGPHRYYFELVGLAQELDPEALSDVPTKEELAELVKGKVEAWGEWIGVYESVWDDR